MSKKILELVDVTMQFGGVKALDSVNFHVNEGEICALIGPNGAGKTTVFNVVTGVYQVTSGDIKFMGESIKGMKRAAITKAGIARTFQNVRLFGDMTALENVITATDVHKNSGLIGALFGLPRARREEQHGIARAHELLQFMGIDHRSDQLGKNLPYGDQRRLEIARALGNKPKLLLLDEPTAGMNPQETAHMTSFIRSLRDDLGITIILIEHDMRVVMDISDQIAVLDYGEKIAEGKQKDIQSNQRVIEAYLGPGGSVLTKKYQERKKLRHDAKR